MKRFLTQCGGSADAGDVETTKKQKVVQKYRGDYTNEWPCLLRSSKSVSHVFCVVCNRDFSVAHGGRDDCRKHVSSKMHADFVKLRDCNKSVTTFFKNSEDESAVTRAELLFTTFLVEHNLPLACSDHSGELFRKMFPDSKIATKYGCARTKTGAVVRSLAKSTDETLTEILKSQPFSLATDGSNDVGDTKLYPLVVSYFDVGIGHITTVILTIQESHDNTGEGIFKLLDCELKKRDIPWENCVGFSCDNASTMTGVTKGVSSFMSKVNENIHVQGCACHLVHLAAQKGCGGLKNINVEQFLIDIYYYLQKSSKRKHILKMCQKVFGEKPHKILKYVSTRWLSLLQSIDRILEQWNPLKMYFCETDHDMTGSKFQKVKEQFEDPSTKLYLLFLSSIIPLFNSLNVFLQQENPVIHQLHSKLNSFFVDVIVRFVKASSVPQSEKDLFQMKFASIKLQKSDAELVIGAKSRAYMKEVNFSEEKLKLFYADVRTFYTRICEYIAKKWPVKTQFLEHIEVADVCKRKEKSFSSIEFLVDQFPKLLTEDETESLETEFSRYQFDSFSSCNSDRVDEIWFKISKLTDSSGMKKYSSLSKLMMAVLLIPHSNSPTERIFSLVRKNKTEFRANMNTELLSALLVHKMQLISQKKLCHQVTFSKQQLQEAKRATRLQNMKSGASTSTQSSSVDATLTEDAVDDEGL